MQDMTRLHFEKVAASRGAFVLHVLDTARVHRRAMMITSKRVDATSARLRVGLHRGGALPQHDAFYLATILLGLL
jgi:hypothetical protein